MPLRIDVSYKSYGLWICAIISVAILFSSCNVAKKVPYFKDVPDSLGSAMTVKHTPFVEPVVQPNDILEITIQTIDSRTADMISGSSVASDAAGSKSSETGGGGSTGVMSPGYLVDHNGEIELPLVGRVKVAGLTTTQVRELLHEKASLYYKEPVVNVRFENFTITMLGDVNHPGRYVIPNEQVSILDAIGLAGDLSISGKRENILLVREDHGDKKFVRFNLNSTDIFKSPYFYLRQGDIVYVQPNKAKSRSATVDVSRDRYITYLASVLTLFIALSYRFPNL